MTISVTISQETASLIRPSQSNFYPGRIPSQHYQLKNFISTAAQDIIYYASAHHIYALHLSTRKRELIADLPWNPQCLSSGHGWICVGGRENGNCAFICINDVEPNAGSGRTSRHAEVDALLPLDLDPESRILNQSFLYRSHRPATVGRRKKPEVQFHDVGREIVNSVTVHYLRSDQNGLEDEVVAVLSNNDRTVRIFSLTQSRELGALRFASPMNHATISPDGQLLIAVGDEPRAFFAKRIRLPSLALDGETAFARYEWHEIAEPRLSLADSADACFSTAFSPSGHICAVASQTGIITIFDTSMIRDGMDADEAVLQVFKSSRPCFGRDFSGAVRSMSFAPAPWDLLAWAEHHGRVCVVDLRNAFRSRQTLLLDTESPTLNRVSISNLEDGRITSEQEQLEIEATFVRRHREALDVQDHLAAVSHAADYMELAAERRRLHREAYDLGLEPTREDFHELTESERHVLESIRTSRLQEPGQARGENVHPGPYSVTYSQSSNIASATRQADLQASVIPSYGNSSSILHNVRGTDSIREYMRQRNLERNRTGDRSYQPRRRSSVVISNSNPTSHSSSTHPSNLIPILTATPTLSASPSRIASTAQTAAQIGDPWHTISEAMDPGPTFDAASRLPLIRRERDAVPTRALERRIQLQQQAARLETVRSYNTHRLRHIHDRAVGRVAAGESVYDDHELDVLRRLTSRETDVGTMGVGWSGDGRNLYVATEEGILEYTVNIEERKTFPGISFQ